MDCAIEPIRTTNPCQERVVSGACQQIHTQCYIAENPRGVGPPEAINQLAMQRGDLGASESRGGEGSVEDLFTLWSKGVRPLQVETEPTAP